MPKEEISIWERNSVLFDGLVTRREYTVYRAIPGGRSRHWTEHYQSSNLRAHPTIHFQSVSINFVSQLVGRNESPRQH